VENLVQVVVKFNNVDHALKMLKKKAQREGLFRALKNSRYFEKRSKKAARKKAEAKRRRDKLNKKVNSSD
jgi:small subunit ribosomal protein S21